MTWWVDEKIICDKLTIKSIVCGSTGVIFNLALQKHITRSQSKVSDQFSLIVCLGSGSASVMCGRRGWSNKNLSHTKHTSEISYVSVCMWNNYPIRNYERMFHISRIHCSGSCTCIWTGQWAGGSSLARIVLLVWEEASVVPQRAGWWARTWERSRSFRRAGLSNKTSLTQIWGKLQLDLQPSTFSSLSYLSDLVFWQ